MNEFSSRITPQYVKELLGGFNWKANILSDTTTIVPYLGMYEELFYFYITTKTDKNHVILKGLFPQTLHKEEQAAMLELCNVINLGYSIGALQLDFKEKQFSYRLGMFRTPYEQFDFQFIENLIYLCDKLEIINQLICDMKKRKIKDRDIIFDSATLIEEKWIEETRTQLWSYRHLKR